MVKMLGILAGLGMACFIVLGAACVKKGAPGMPATAVDSVAADPGADSAATLSYLALGDSYTIGQSVGEADRYPVQLVALLRSAGLAYADPVIIARTGWTTGNLLGALPAGGPQQPYHLVSLLIGVNNQYQGRSTDEYRIEFGRLVDSAVMLAGGRVSHVIVLSIPDYSVTPFARSGDQAGIAAQIDAFNAINQSISDARGVHYIDITGDSRKAATDASLIAGDSLHFSGKEYGIWAGKMLPLVRLIKN